jgi:hypothetical protein
MSPVAKALGYAFVNLLHPRMLWLMLWPLIVALGIWGTLALVFWGEIIFWLAARVKEWIQTATFFVSWDAGSVALFSAKALVLLLLVPLVQLTALFILGVFGMPQMVEHVARRYPVLARRHGGSFAGSVWNGVVALLGLVLLGAASIPLWVFPPLWPVIPVLVVGWVNQRLLRYDALAEHADAGEMRSIIAAERGTLYLLGLALALVAYVPIVGFFAPVLFGLAFIHYLLGCLQAQREAPVEASAQTIDA